MSLGGGQNMSLWDSLGQGPHLNPSTDSLVTPGKSLNVSGHPSQTNMTTTIMSWQVLSWKPSRGTLILFAALHQSPAEHEDIGWDLLNSGVSKAGPQLLVKQDMAMTA